MISKRLMRLWRFVWPDDFSGRLFRVVFANSLAIGAIVPMALYDGAVAPFLWFIAGFLTGLTVIAMGLQRHVLYMQRYMEQRAHEVFSQAGNEILGSVLDNLKHHGVIANWGMDEPSDDPPETGRPKSSLN